MLSAPGKHRRDVRLCQDLRKAGTPFAATDVRHRQAVRVAAREDRIIPRFRLCVLIGGPGRFFVQRCFKAGEVFLLHRLSLAGRVNIPKQYIRTLAVIDDVMEIQEEVLPLRCIV